MTGIVSDGDVLRYLAPKPIGIAGLVYIIEDGKIEDVLQQKLNTPVKEIMTKRNIAYVSIDEDFERTIRLISRHHFKKLPVVNGVGRVVGILSRGDLIQNISKNFIREENAQLV